MCPICIAVAGLFAAVFRPWSLRRRRKERAASWRLSDTNDAGHAAACSQTLHG